MADRAASSDQVPVRTARLDPSFWRGRKVFLTGHTGFKGSWLALWLDALSANVTGYALEPPTEPNLYHDARVDRGLRSIIADVRDFERLKAALADVRPEVVLHLAAQSVVRRSYGDPIETYASNVMGTVHLFEAVRQLGLRCAIVNVTSDKCYAPRPAGPGFRESDPFGGDDPYSSSKGCAELVTSCFRRSYFPPEALDRHGVGLGSARAGNAIGGGDWTEDQLVPDLIRAFQANRACLIRRPDGVRPWQFVLEPLHGYLLLAERLARGDAEVASGWNFGPPDSEVRPVSWIADRVRQLWGGTAQWVRDDRAHPAETAELRLDPSRATQHLGWRPTLGLAEALAWTVQWYQAWAAGEDARQLTVDQIARYEQLAGAAPPGGQG